MKSKTGAHHTAELYQIFTGVGTKSVLIFNMTRGGGRKAHCIYHLVCCERSPGRPTGH
jgi:hypothetical protein